MPPAQTARAARPELRHDGAVRVLRVEVAPLSVPLRDPFVIASATVRHTLSALVRVVAEAPGGGRVEGLGEAAALPPVTPEDQADLLAALSAVSLADRRVARVEDVVALLPAAMGRASRAGLECALLDAFARSRGQPLCAILGGGDAALLSDITLPIGEPAHLATLAAAYQAEGFHSLKLKVGRDLGADRETLARVHEAAPGARFRFDANAGYRAADALALLDAARALGAEVECFEEPCRRFEDMAEVTREAGVPVVADESLRSLDDVDRIAAAGAADGVNLKLAKLGGLLAARAVAERARRHGLRLMAGAMVETRLGLCAMAHLVTAIGGVEWLDLDTALLLTADPFEGGYRSRGPRMELLRGAGLGIRAA